MIVSTNLQKPIDFKKDLTKTKNPNEFKDDLAIIE